VVGIFEFEMAGVVLPVLAPFHVLEKEPLRHAWRVCVCVCVCVRRRERARDREREKEREREREREREKARARARIHTCIRIIHINTYIHTDIHA
jgi:hypothetical protein